MTAALRLCLRDCPGMSFGSPTHLPDEPCGLAYRVLQRLTDEELMRHLRGGHHDALTVLFDRYHRLVLKVALSIVRDSGEAQDVVQEVFLQVYRTVVRFDPARGSSKM